MSFCAHFDSLELFCNIYKRLAWNAIKLNLVRTARYKKYYISVDGYTTQSLRGETSNNDGENLKMLGENLNMLVKSENVGNNLKM